MSRRSTPEQRVRFRASDETRALEVEQHSIWTPPRPPTPGPRRDTTVYDPYLVPETPILGLTTTNTRYVRPGPEQLKLLERPLPGFL